jgi:hypothetical protein
MVTLEKIIKVNLPDEIDPEIEFSDAPIAQILVANVGSRSPIVARTILQSKDFSGLHRESSRPAIQEIAWRVMESLLAFDRTIASIQRSIDTVKKTIEIEFERYVVGSSPSHPPIAEGVEADFRSAVLLSHAALNDVSELFPLILAAKCKRGRYDQIIAWSRETFGENDVLSLMLQADHSRCTLSRPARRAGVQVSSAAAIEAHGWLVSTRDEKEAPHRCERHRLTRR